MNTIKRMSVSYRDVEAATGRLEGVANRTPVFTSRTFNEMCGCKAFFKMENYQRVGAFKFRGAYNAFSQLTEEQKRNGVLTFSSGNHGAACALAGKLLGVPVVVVMNDDAPKLKIEAVKGYGAEAVLYDRSETVREELGRKIASERGLTVVPPYDHEHIVAGQGTAGKELFEEVRDLDVFLCGVGGGGVLSGCCLAAHALAPGAVVYGVEPELGNDAQQSLRKGEIVSLAASPDTIADGARTTSIGRINFEVLSRHVREIVTVSDEELLAATRFFFERMKAVVEPTGALGTAAVMSGKVEVKGKRIGVMVTGGNADLGLLARRWGLCPKAK
jgi:threonine dehydratase